MTNLQESMFLKTKYKNILQKRAKITRCTHTARCKTHVAPSKGLNWILLDFTASDHCLSCSEWSLSIHLMDNRQDRGNPWERANIISRTFFCWVLPLFQKGYKKDLDEDDLYDCCLQDTSEYLGDKLQRQWHKELRGKSDPSLTRAVIRTFAGPYLLSSFLALIEECLIRTMQAVMLGWLVHYYSDDFESHKTEAFLSAAGVCATSLFYVMTHHPFFFGIQRSGMQLRIACCTLLYRKALKLSRGSIGQTTVGQMVNLLSNDVNRFDQSVLFLPYLVVGPLQTAITVAVLWRHVGVACLAGLSVLLLCIPIQSGMGKCFSKLRFQTAILTDERVRLMNEILSGMRVIKMYTWELPFSKLVAEAREKEVFKIKVTSMLRGINIALFFVSSKVILFACFITFVLMDGQLTAERVFVSVALFNNLRLTMTFFVPFAIAQWAESRISLKRIQKFLVLEEKDQAGTINGVGLRPKPEKCGIWLNGLSAQWNDKMEEPTLSNISVDVNPGELLAVVGPVGAGKTSLLMTLLGELPSTFGEVKLRGKVAYASQEPWVFAGNVRENVIFGAAMDDNKYNKVLQVCALDKDVIQFPHGDLTLVGEKGVSLSGGQKARVNLARALYLDADIYLMDDPLSAVDTSVAKHLFEKCINGYLKDKARVLVTHQVQFLKAATKILVLKDGKCFALGNYNELVATGFDLMSVVDKTEEKEKVESKEEIVVASYPSAITLYESAISLASSIAEEPVDRKIQALDIPKQSREIMATGSVKGRVYLDYFRAGSGPCFFFVCMAFMILTQVVFSGSEYWLTLWTDSEEAKNRLSQNNTNANETNLENKFPIDLYTNIYVYTGMIGGLLILSLLRTTMFFIICMKASVQLHNRMFTNITRTQINFFDSNPVGRILNRFTKDLGTIDDLLPLTLFDIVTILLFLLSIVGIIVSVNPWLSIPSFLISVVFVYIRKYYIKTGRDIKRLEGITRSPVFSHMATSLYGLTTIRAFAAQDVFEKQFCVYQDNHTTSWFLFISTTRSFGVVLDLLSVLFITIVTAFLVIHSSGTTGGNVGLAISSALTLSGMLQWGVRQSAEVESQMTSVERIMEYGNLPLEASLTSTPSKKPPSDWPQKGEVVLQNVSLRYTFADPPVLKGLACVFKAQEKIGIVGRTGAGKSSMISALFRMSEPEGNIYIDGVATKDIGLHELRSKISIIPQDPVLFTGPIRRNIDPFGDHTDDNLWNVLKEVQLKEAVDDLPGGLDSIISEGGGNFSVGQRQLVCLARAILRKNRILVLDEATANVDHRTDYLIQQTIREKFRYCTVLTIAHRLNTIMDSDKVLVLDAGRIIEFDEPYTLLQREDGHFSSMVSQTGRIMAQQLRSVARKAYEQRRSNSEASSDSGAEVESFQQPRHSPS